VLILPPGHAQAVSARRRLSAREKWILRGVLGTVAVLAVAVVIALATAGHSSGNGCVDVNIPYSTGGQELYRCGGEARAMCRAVGTPGGFTGAAAHAVATECRKAGLAVGS